MEQEEEIEMYQMYKGLKRPLEFGMFKGKFIYWAGGCLVGGMIIGGVIAGTVNNLLGGALFILLGGGGLFWVYTYQNKNGLNKKAKQYGLFIIKPIHHIRKNGQKHN